MYHLTTKSDLQSLIDNHVFENREIEYKADAFPDGKIDDAVKSKLHKEVTAFANAMGGSIVIGISEDEDHCPKAICGTKMSFKKFDQWQTAFQQSVRARVRPPLHGMDITPIELEEDNIAIVISVPKSYARPHSVWDGNKDMFYIRNASGVAPMDIEDLRKAFLFSNVTQERVTQFRRDRISMILANECVGSFGNSALVVFHIVPEWSMELGNMIDLGYYHTNISFRPTSGTGWHCRYNADGYCAYVTMPHSTHILRYTQVFRNGCIEVAETLYGPDKSLKAITNWVDVLGNVRRSINDYGSLLKDQDVPKPWRIFATLLNAKGFFIDNGWNTSEEAERDVVFSQDGTWTEDNTSDDALKPVFDSLANAFGDSSSGFFD